MPQLTELPNEILGHIMTFFLCDDIDNFSACCKHFKTLSAADFPKHKERKKQLSCVTFGTPKCGVFGPFSHPADFLRALLQNLTIASYVKTLRVHYARPMSFSSLIKSLEKEVRDFVESLPYLTVHEKATWIQALIEGDRDRFFALILTLLPFLRKLTLRFVGPENEYSSTAVQELLVAASRPEHTNQTMLLCKLTHVELSTSILQPRLIHLLGGLPSMRNFRAKSMFDLDERWSASHAGSRLTKLLLGECQIGLESLRRILDSITALQEFAYGFYSEDSKGRGSGLRQAPIEPKEVVQSLLQSASRSLVSLDLTDLGFKFCDSEIEKSRFMGSLQGFQVLKRIRVEYILFVEHVPTRSAQVIQIHRIADVIPASLESVTLVGPELSMDDMAKLVDGLGEHTRTSSQEHAIEAKTKSNLEKVVYEHYGSSAELEMLAQLFSKVQGIEFM